MKLQGEPRNTWPPKARFCKEHNVQDVLGTVEDIYINEDDNWLWADIKSKKTETDRLNDHLFDQNIRGVSMGYYLEDKNRPYKEIEEISLVRNPDFINSRVKVIHSADEITNLFIPFFTPPDMEDQDQQQQQQAPLSDDAPVGFSPEDFDKLTPEEKVEFLKRSAQLEHRFESERAQKEQEESSKALEEAASPFMSGINTLVGTLETEDDKKEAVGSRMLDEALKNELFGKTVKLADVAIAKEKARVAEVERQNKELRDQVASLNSNAKKAAIAAAKQNSAFGNNRSAAKVNHNANMSSSSSPSSSRSLFSIMNSKRTRAEHESSPPFPSSSSSSSSSSSCASEAMEPPAKAQHSASSSHIPAEYLYSDPLTGFSLAPLWQEPSQSSTQRTLVTHSADSTTPLTIEYDDSNVGHATLSLLRNVVEGRRNFGDAWHPEMLKNSMIALNPKTFVDIIGQKLRVGNHRSNAEEGVFGHQSERFKTVFVDPNSPKINPYHRKDAAFMQKYHVSSSDYGVRDFSLI